MISARHRNRRLHNWLIYDISDRFLLRFAPCYRGVLYDLGCGEAPYRAFFLQHAARYVGVDWAASQHDTQAEVIADLNQPLPVAAQVADSVVSLSVLEHLCEPQVMLDEAFRILRPGGRIVLQVPWQWWVHEAPHDFHRYTPFALRRMLSKSGFVEVQVEPQAGVFTTLVLKWNYFTHRYVRGPRWMRTVITLGLAPLWYVGQRMAPLLDRLDHDWQAEASGYFVVATKP